MVEHFTRNEGVPSSSLGFSSKERIAARLSSLCFSTTTLNEGHPKSPFAKGRFRGNVNIHIIKTEGRRNFTQLSAIRRRYTADRLTASLLAKAEYLMGKGEADESCKGFYK